MPDRGDDLAVAATAAQALVLEGATHQRRDAGARRPHGRNQRPVSAPRNAVLLAADEMPEPVVCGGRGSSPRGVPLIVPQARPRPLPGLA